MGTSLQMMVPNNRVHDARHYGRDSLLASTLHPPSMLQQPIFEKIKLCGDYRVLLVCLETFEYRRMYCRSTCNDTAFCFLVWS